MFSAYVRNIELSKFMDTQGVPTSKFGPSETYKPVLEI